MFSLQPHTFPGIFIVYEGVNGCGKSTQAFRLHNWLEAHKVATVLTKEPTKEFFVGQRIRQALQDKDLIDNLGPRVFQSWYALDSQQHLREVVIPALKRGAVVVSDRYRPSLVHSATDESDIDDLLELNADILKEDFTLPDATFIFDVNLEIAMERLQKRGVALDVLESARGITRTRERYLQLVQRWPASRVIDGGREEKEIFMELKVEILSLIRAKMGHKYLLSS